MNTTYQEVLRLFKEANLSYKQANDNIRSIELFEQVIATCEEAGVDEGIPEYIMAIGNLYKLNRQLGGWHINKAQEFLRKFGEKGGNPALLEQEYNQASL